MIEHFERFQSLYTQTCADLDECIASLAECAEAGDYTRLADNARALALLAGDAEYQRGEMEHAQYRIRRDGLAEPLGVG
jgi:hypothetical protein